MSNKNYFFPLVPADSKKPNLINGCNIKEKSVESHAVRVKKKKNARPLSSGPPLVSTPCPLLSSDAWVIPGPELGVLTKSPPVGSDRWDGLLGATRPPRGKDPEKGSKKKTPLCLVPFEVDQIEKAVCRMRSGICSRGEKSVKAGPAKRGYDSKGKLRLQKNRRMLEGGGRGESGFRRLSSMEFVSTVTCARKSTISEPNATNVIFCMQRPAVQPALASLGELHECKVRRREGRLSRVDGGWGLGCGV